LRGIKDDTVFMAHRPTKEFLSFVSTRLDTKIDGLW